MIEGVNGEARVVIRRVEGEPGKRVWLWCPGCLELHQVQVADEDGGVPTGPVWTFNGDLHSPTIDPSILVQGGRNGSDARCHSFVRAGVWEFLDDCTHSLSGQHFPMGDMPAWMSARA